MSNNDIKTHKDAIRQPRLSRE